MWVLDHGLPVLPDVLGDDDEVPIACWAVPALGAVLFRSWWSGSGEDGPSPHVNVSDDHYSFVRSEGVSWEPTGGGGGTAGPEADPMRASPRPDRLAFIGGDRLEGGVRGVTGSVGAAARSIELIDRQGRTSRSVGAPLGSFIVCFDPLDEVTIRVLDDEGQALLETRRIPGRW
jgi:hypothetical protein